MRLNVLVIAAAASLLACSSSSSSPCRASGCGGDSSSADDGGGGSGAAGGSAVAGEFGAAGDVGATGGSGTAGGSAAAGEFGAAGDVGAAGDSGGVDGAFNTDITTPLSGAQLVRDGQGRLHLLAASPIPDAQHHTATVYGMCSRDCGSPAGWSFATIDDGGALDNAVKLAVDGSGRVHVVELLEDKLRYATCASSCFDGASWTAADISLGPDLTSVHLPTGRAFAVSAAGKPRVLISGIAGAGSQTFVLGCDGTCTDGTGWEFAAIADGTATAAAITGDEPHQAVLALDRDFALVYAECSSGCGAAASWTQSALLSANSTFVGLVRSADGALHLAYNSTVDDPGDVTMYGVCSASCLESASWTLVPVDQGEKGRGGLDLAVASSGTVAIAQAAPDGHLQVLSWSTCARGCTQPSSWSHALVDRGIDVHDPYSTLLGSACSKPVLSWATGTLVQLVASGADAFQLAYDATNYDVCLESTTPTYYIRASAIRLQSRRP